jgi:transposase
LHTPLRLAKAAEIAFPGGGMMVAAADSVRAALRFDFANVAIQFAGALESCALGCDAASGGRVGSPEANHFFAPRFGPRETDWKMTKRARRNHTPAFKAKVALAAMKGDKTHAELAQLFDVHPNEIGQWRSQLLEGAAGLFGAPENSVQTEAPAPTIILPVCRGGKRSAKVSPEQAMCAGRQATLKIRKPSISLICW